MLTMTHAAILLSVLFGSMVVAAIVVHVRTVRRGVREIHQRWCRMLSMMRDGSISQSEILFSSDDVPLCQRRKELFALERAGYAYRVLDEKSYPYWQVTPQGHRFLEKMANRLK